MYRPLSMSEWLETWDVELMELPEDADLDAVYKEYLANFEEAYIDANTQVSQRETISYPLD